MVISLDNARKLVAEFPALKGATPPGLGVPRGSRADGENNAPADKMKIMTRYKNPMMQRMYETCLNLAAVPDSEFWHNGVPSRGAGHRCAFWDGYAGLAKSPMAQPGSLAMAAFQAGRQFAKTHPGIQNAQYIQHFGHNIMSQRHA